MFKRLSNFFKTIWLSVSSIPHYQNVLTQRTGTGIGYLYGFLTTVCFLMLLTFAIFATTLFPFLKLGIAELKATLPTLYPPELIMTFKDGELSTNMPEPVVIPMPERWKKYVNDNELEIEGKKGAPANLVVIDTSASVEDYPRYETFALLTKTSVIIPKDGGYNVQGFDRAKDLVITKAKVDDMLTKVFPFLDMAPSLFGVALVFLVLLGPWFLAAFWLLWNLLYLLIAALVVWLIARLLRRTYTYGQLYRLSLYGLTLPVLVTWVAGFVDLEFTWFFTLVFLGWMAFVLSKLPQVSASGMAMASPTMPAPAPVAPAAAVPPHGKKSKKR
jgi:hypothetical protein